ncbi:PH domain-containing protein [Aquihabitans sp. G128]|uniref:PH domain-containing protein n=1 Tax=Aquihabitans sp. G128 TaxID=2849779 RepID=UPI001C23806B|nr:PH domain-containing protein [Aquihabitans sp. G128]QXC61174.1 PH domain-containing protein [Aquihabitans sp. G128]
MGTVSVLALVWPPWWGFVVALLIVVIGGVLVTSLSGPNLAAVGVSADDRLLVRPVGLVRLFGLTNGVVVPVTSVVDVGVEERKDLALGLRLPGAHVPGLLTAGTFRRHGERALWMVGRNEKVLVIELTGERYRHLVLGVEDPEAATEALRAAINRER